VPKIKTYNLQQLKSEQLLQMSKLRRTDGMLWPTIKILLNKPNIFSRVVIVEEKGNILGWGLLRKAKKDSDIMLYVRRSHRRQGLGTKIVCRINRIYKFHKKSKKLGDLHFYTETDQGNFFESVGYQ
jgi:GNAT superfamily N-acetyltransferase